MLDAEPLNLALINAVQQANRCRRWCSSGAERTEAGYRCWHNGAGSDTADQIVTAEGILKLSPEVLTTRLREWIGKLHDGKVTDLNGYAAG